MIESFFESSSLFTGTENNVLFLKPLFLVNNKTGAWDISDKACMTRYFACHIGCSTTYPMVHHNKLRLIARVLSKPRADIHQLQQ